MNKDAALIEETLAHLVRMVDDLSAIVARQDREIARMASRIEALMRAEAERIADAGSIPIANQRPPHW